MNIQQIKLITSLTILNILALSFTVHAAPSITSTSGTISHGQVITVNGSSFGVKSPVGPLQWDPVDGMYSGLTNGNIIPVGGSNPWASTEMGEPTYYKTTNPRGKWTAKYSNQWSISGDGKATVGGNNYPSAGGKILYVSWWINPASDMTIGATNSSNKFCRFTPDAGWDTATFIWEPDKFYDYDFSTGYHYSQWKAWNGNYGAWNRMEVTIDNTANPKPRMTGYINNNLFISGISGDGTGTSGGATTGAVSADITGIYVIGFDASNSDGKQPIVDFGEIYVDNTLARVEICNASTKSGSNHCEIQIPQTTWTANQLQLKVNQGSFADNSTAYLYVLDSSGTANPTGYPVTFGSSGGGGGDTTPPTNVAITTPLSGTTVSGNVSVTATASDNLAVAKVEFYVDSTSSTPVATDTASPYSFTWNSSTVSNGSHTLYAKASDAAGNSTVSAGVAITVSNSVADTTPPTVSITAPAGNATVSGNTTVTATASDNIGVTKVDFYVDNATTPAATATAAPYIFTWNTTTIANGSHTIYAKASDAAGNVGTSSVSLTVSNTITSGTYSVIFGNTSDSNYPNTVNDTFLDISTSVNATSTLLSAYTWPTNAPANAILMQWNLSALPANAQIQSATLQLYMNSGGGDSLYAIPARKVINKSPVISNCNGYYYDGSNPWDPSNIAYNSIPLAQADIAPAVDTQQINMTYGYKSWNVTSIVKDWVATPASNYGLLLNGSVANSADSYRSFASSRATDPAQRPKLVITYTTGLSPVQNVSATVISSN